jgi:hypothetical protein
MSLDASDRPVREVFLAALEIEDEAWRRVFMDEELGIDTDRRREVEQL